MTSVDGVVADLVETERKLAAAHEAVITALEAGEKLSSVESLEQEVKEVTAKRDDLVETKQFMVKRERQRAERDNKKLSTAQYISQWDPSLKIEDIAKLALDSHHRNESVGITGALYVFRGWFASYLEGEDSNLDTVLTKIARDPRHTGFAILKRERGLPASTPRKIPEVGLRLQWVNDESNAATKHEAFIIASLCQQLALTGFVPRSVLTQAEQLNQRKENSCAMDEVGQTIAGRESSALDCPVQDHYVVSIAPCSDAFWDGGAADGQNVSSAGTAIANLNTSEQLEDPAAMVPQCLEAVVKVAKKVWERPTEDSYFTAVGGDFGSTAAGQQLGSVLGPHGAERLLVTSGRFVDEALARCVQFVRTFKELYPLESSMYQPTLAIHCGEIQAPVNGRLTIVGSMLRGLQQLSLVAKQEGLPIAVGYKVADDANRRGLQSYGHFLFDGTPDEVFVPDAFPKSMFAPVRSTAQFASADDEGGVLQQLPTQGSLKVDKPAADPMTIDELNVEPPKGFVQEDEIRKAFDALFPDPKDDTIAMETYAGYYQGFDHMGVNEQVGEMEGRMGAFQPGKEKMATVKVPVSGGISKSPAKKEITNVATAAGGSGGGTANAALAHKRVTFDQFAMMWYRRMQ